MVFEKIDAHQHFWRYSKADFGWIQDDQFVLKRDFLPEDFAKELESVGYSGSIAVQARQSLEETRWLLSLAENSEEILAVVAWVDLQSSELKNQLEEFALNQKFKGVRHVVQDEPADDFIVQPAFVKGVSCLQEYGLIYEILIYPKQLKYAAKLVGSLPNQGFVLDHIAKPNIKSGEIIEWAEGIRQLASFQNVSVKVSGMVTEANHQSWKPEDFKPYLDIIWNEFGEDRIMLGSDWPVCTLAASYSQVICLIEGYFESHGERVWKKVYGDNARRIYRL